MTELVFNITTAAKSLKRTRQAVYVAIKKKKMNAKKERGRYLITKTDIDEYIANKYSRAKSTYNGRLLFDNNAGYFSMTQTAKMLNIPLQRLYYAARVGQIRYERKGSAYVIHMSNIVLFKETYLDVQIKSA